MKYFNFDGWDRDNGSSLNLIFGSLENIEKFSTNDFLKVFEIDELEDEGELQKFEYPDYFNFGSMIRESSEFHLFAFDGNIKGLEDFLDRFNVDFVWHLTTGEFQLIHDHTLNGNEFDEAKLNFIDNELISHVLVTRVVSF